MITAWDIYWITRLDGLNVFLCVCVICYLIAFVGGAIFTCAREIWSEDFWPQAKKIWRWGAISFLVLVLISVFIPTTKEVVAIYMIPKITNNEQVQKLPDNAMKALNGKFEEWIADMTPKKKSGGE